MAVLLELTFLQTERSKQRAKKCISSERERETRERERRSEPPSSDESQDASELRDAINDQAEKLNTIYELLSSQRGLPRLPDT